MGIGKSVLPESKDTQIPKLSELGLDYKTSSLAQKIAIRPYS